jgi:hypothetical protein
MEKKLSKKFNGYKLQRDWFKFLQLNSSNINTNHSALYNYIINRANTLGWVENIQLPTEFTMIHSGFKNAKTYRKTLTELIDLKVIRLVSLSTNQYNATIVALVDLTEALTEPSTLASTQALPKH